jgi:hypothetical protein
MHTKIKVIITTISLVILGIIVYYRVFKYREGATAKAKHKILVYDISGKTQNVVDVEVGNSRIVNPLILGIKYITDSWGGPERVDISNKCEKSLLMVDNWDPSGVIKINIKKQSITNAQVVGAEVKQDNKVKGKLSQKIDAADIEEIFVTPSGGVEFVGNKEITIGSGGGEINILAKNIKDKMYANNSPNLESKYLNVKEDNNDNLSLPCLDCAPGYELIDENHNIIPTGPWTETKFTAWNKDISISRCREKNDYAASTLVALNNTPAENSLLKAKQLEDIGILKNEINGLKEETTSIDTRLLYARRRYDKIIIEKHLLDTWVFAVLSVVEKTNTQPSSTAVAAVKGYLGETTELVARIKGIDDLRLRYPAYTFAATNNAMTTKWPSTFKDKEGASKLKKWIWGSTSPTASQITPLLNSYGLMPLYSVSKTIANANFANDEKIENKIKEILKLDAKLSKIQTSGTTTLDKTTDIGKLISSLATLLGNAGNTSAVDADLLKEEGAINTILIEKTANIKAISKKTSAMNKLVASNARLDTIAAKTSANTSCPSSQAKSSLDDIGRFMKHFKIMNAAKDLMENKLCHKIQGFTNFDKKMTNSMLNNCHNKNPDEVTFWNMGQLKSGPAGSSFNNI